MLLFLLLFLFGITASPGRDCNCLPCKYIPNGQYSGDWTLLKTNSSSCPLDSNTGNGCLYVNNGTEAEKCFCDPGDTPYDDVCSSVVTQGISILDAIIAIENTVHKISDNLINLPIKARQKRQTEDFSSEENKLLELTATVTTYLQDECTIISNNNIARSGNCKSSKIAELRVSLESTFLKLNNTSSTFIDAFQEQLKLFDEVVKLAKEVHAVKSTTATILRTTTRSTQACPARNVRMRRSDFIQLDQRNLVEGDGACYSDSPRLLDNYRDSSTNTPDECKKTCSSLGYSYAGVQYTKECWCGNDRPPASRIVDSSECDMICSGDAAQICGGASRMNIYKTDMSTTLASTAAMTSAIPTTITDEGDLCAVLYEDSEYGGNYLNLYANSTNDMVMTGLDNGWNDKTSSIRIMDGNSLDVYQHTNFAGWKKTYTSDTAHLSNEDDSISSLRCSVEDMSTTLASTAAMTSAIPTTITAEGDTRWELGMNINPCDGGNFGYGGPWAPVNDVGSADNAFTKDFVDTDIWKKHVGFITIARHVDGKCTMSKTWKLTEYTKSMYDYFSTYPGRIYATGDGSVNDNHIASDIPDSADGLEGEWKDPIFGAEGGLVFNWYYSNNGARIAIPGGYKIPYSLPAVNDNDEDLHGLGNELSGDTIHGNGGGEWNDVAKIGPDCYGSPHNTCPSVGTDHSHHMANGPCWGSYAIFLSQNATHFNCQGKSLSQTLTEEHISTSSSLGSTPTPVITTQETIIPVSCGGHNATSCSQCTKAHGESWCNGDCTWNDGKCIPIVDLGIEACIHEKRVDKECRCGGETCYIGDTCTGGKCVTDFECPVGYKLKNSASRKQKMTKESELPSDADCFDKDITYKGETINQTTTNSTDKSEAAAECQDLCYKTDGCFYFSWVSNQTCYLKSSKIGTTSNEGAVSGPRSCKEELEFQIVPIDSNGPMATREEIEANLEKVKKMLNKCDIFQIEGGSLGGDGYISQIDHRDVEGYISQIDHRNVEENDENILNENCTDCQYKVNVIEEEPDEEFNENVADKCCFIIRSSHNTYVLTNHSLLESFPNEECSSGCMYTLYEDLPYIDADQHCLGVDPIKDYTCCSDEMGAFCQNYGEETKNNTKGNGTCSNVCTEIANCSSDLEINKDWCQIRNLMDEKNSTEESSNEDYSTEEHSTEDLSTEESSNEDYSTEENATSRKKRSVNVSIPENCIPNVPTPVIQTAVFYPAALIPEPFSETRNQSFGNTSRLLRGRSSCNYWFYWRFTCTQAYNYPTYHIRKNWYRVHYKKRWFKHACCHRFQPQCSKRRGRRPYSCPSG